MLPAKLNVNVDVSEESQQTLLKAAGKIFEPFGLGAALLSDQIAFFRLKCLFQIIEKAKDILEKNGYDPQPISEKFLSRFIDGASIENNPKIQDMWANLLAGESVNNENAIFVNILKELSSNGANLLEAIYERALKDNYDPHEDFINLTCDDEDYGSFSKQVTDYESEPNMFLISSATLSEKGRKSKAAKENFELLTHMQHLGLIKVQTLKADRQTRRYTYATYASITPLGFKFMKACKEFNEDNNGN